MPTYYEILGVSESSEPEVITAAYKALMRKYHPDVNKSADAAVRAKELNEAYEILRTPIGRLEYNKKIGRSRSHSSSDTSWSESPPSAAYPPNEQHTGSEDPHSSNDKHRTIKVALIAIFVVAGAALISKIHAYHSDENIGDEFSNFSVVPEDYSTQTSIAPKTTPTTKMPDAAASVIFPRPALQKRGSISGEDYPASSLHNGEQGTSLASFTIGTNGKVISCEASGGTPSLDDTTCKLIKGRFRFRPALDAAGRPVEETRTQRVTWRLPWLPKPPVDPRRAAQRAGSITGDDYPTLAIRNREEGTTVATITIGTDGKVSSCNATGATPTLDAETCKLILRRFRFRPAVDASNQPIEETKTQQVTWRLPD